MWELLLLRPRNLLLLRGVWSLCIFQSASEDMQNASPSTSQLLHFSWACPHLEEWVVGGSIEDSMAESGSVCASVAFRKSSSASLTSPSTRSSSSSWVPWPAGCGLAPSSSDPGALQDSRAHNNGLLGHSSLACWEKTAQGSAQTLAKGGRGRGPQGQPPLLQALAVMFSVRPGERCSDASRFPDAGDSSPGRPVARRAASLCA